LPEEKQKAILNAAMSIFAADDYKKATTDEIVKKAGISKGLLFHYFENKKGLYLYLYKFSEHFLIEEMRKDYDQTETDFFAMLIIAQNIKVKIMKHYPDLFAFLTKAYLEKDSAVQADINCRFGDLIASSCAMVLQRADLYKFKESISPEKVLNLIILVSDSLMRNRSTEPIDNLLVINDEYLTYLDMMKQNFYKEEYL
jgi:AcrR family transcriptional regulator